MAAKLFDPWKPLFGGYMPLSLLVSYRRDRGGLLATVLLEMYVADRLSLADLRKARLTLPAHMPDAYDSLPVVLDDLVEAAEVAGREMASRSIQRPRTADEARSVRAMVLEVVEGIVGGPVQVRWQFPRHLRPPEEQMSESLADVIHDDPPIRSELVVAAGGAEDELFSGDDEDSGDSSQDPLWGARTASVQTSLRSLRAAPPVEDSDAIPAEISADELTPPDSEAPDVEDPGKPGPAPVLVNPFSGGVRRPEPAAHVPDTDDGDERTLVVNPGDLAARLSAEAAAAAASNQRGGDVPLSAVQGWEVGTPAGEELSLDSEDPAARGADLAVESADDYPSEDSTLQGLTSPPADALGEPLSRALDTLLAELEAGLFLDPHEAGGAESLAAWRREAVAATQRFATRIAAEGSPPEESARTYAGAVVRAVESVLAIQGRLLEALADAGSPPSHASQVAQLEEALACVVTQVERISDGRPLDDDRLVAGVGDHPSVVEAVRRLSREARGWRSAAAAPARAAATPLGLPAAAVSQGSLKWELAEREREARSLRILSAWGQLRALLAELREEVAEAVEPRDLFERPALSDAERGRMLLQKWEDIQRYAEVLRDKLPEESLAPQLRQMRELSTFMEALAGQGAHRDSDLIG